MWFFNKIPKHIPAATGPYIPGCADVLVDYSKSGFFLRIFYPTNELNNKNIEKQDFSKWCPSIPDDDYVNSFADVLHVPNFVVNFALWKSGTASVPVHYGAKIKENDKFKCILLSHGLGAYRSHYNCICIELASRGYIVAVLEHRDESSCFTYYYKSKEDAAKNLRTSIKYKNIPFGKEHYEKRHMQVKKRAEECSQVLDFFINLNKGEVPHNIINDVPNNNQSDFTLKDLIGKIDVDNFIMAGHSFGGATALLTISQRPEFKLGLLFDPWMFPIKNENLPDKINKRLLFINTYTFHIKTNVNAMEKFVTEKKVPMYTILDSTHETQTDSVFIVGYWLNWLMKKIDPHKGILINNYLILDFLAKHTEHSVSIDDCKEFLSNESNAFYMGLTKAWA